MVLSHYSECRGKLVIFFRNFYNSHLSHLFHRPLTVHCSPGTGRTGTIIACDIALRQLEIPPRQIDIPKIVYYVRRSRASSVRAKEQYEFIYKVSSYDALH